jgi:hypothetical protein
MSKEEPSTFRPFIFTVIEDDGINVTIEVSEENYQAEAREKARRIPC